jgi:hypothetical protein
MTEPRIVRFEFDPPRPKPAGLLDPMPTVVATFDDGSRKELFSFYPDEIRFDEGELVGMTEGEQGSCAGGRMRGPSGPENCRVPSA